MNEEIVKQIKEAKALIEQGWCQRNYAQNKFASAVPYDDPDAKYWCITGSLLKVTEESHLVKFFRSGLVDWNDNFARTKNDILEEFDKAITAAENNTPRQYSLDYRGEEDE